MKSLYQSISESLRNEAENLLNAKLFTEIFLEIIDSSLVFI